MSCSAPLSHVDDGLFVVEFGYRPRALRTAFCGVAIRCGRWNESHTHSLSIGLRVLVGETPRMPVITSIVHRSFDDRSDRTRCAADYTRRRQPRKTFAELHK